MQIKKFISQKCIGYSEDFSQTYTEHVVLLESGEEKTVWNAQTTFEDGTIRESRYTEDKPFVAMVALGGTWELVEQNMEDLEDYLEIKVVLK